MSNDHAASCGGSSRSRGIHDLIGGHNRVTPEWIADATLFNHIHRPAEYCLQLVKNVRRIVKGKSVTRSKLEHDINVALGPKVIPKHRSEEREFLDAVLLAE